MYSTTTDVFDPRERTDDETLPVSTDDSADDLTSDDELSDDELTDDSASTDDSADDE